MLARLSIILISIFIFNYSTYSQFISFKLKENTVSESLHPGNPVSKPMKSSFLAGTLSFIVPGAALGQFYNEEYLNGAIRVGISAICVGWFLASPSVNTGGGGNGDQKIIAGLLSAANWIASIIDASVSANHYNSKSINLLSDRVKLQHNFHNSGMQFSFIF